MKVVLWLLVLLVCNGAGLVKSFMNASPEEWLRFAEENLVALMCLEDGLYNPSIQNAQQVIEKALKGICSSRGLPLKLTQHLCAKPRLSSGRVSGQDGRPK